MRATRTRTRSLSSTPRLPAFLIVLLILVATAGCNKVGEFAKDRADIAAYRIIEEKQEEAFSIADPFTIDPIENDALRRALETPRVVGVSENAEITTPAVYLSLADALAIAFAGNREYQSRKEQLFEQALNLTENRRDYGYLFDFSGGASHTKSETGHGTLEGASIERFGEYNWAGALKKTLVTGASVSVGFAHRFSRYFSTDLPQKSSTSSFSFGIVQPLLNGVGPIISHEPLKQAERTMIYNVRDFHRYQKTFAIGILSDYYQLLRSLDAVRNQRVSWESAVFQANRNRAHANEGLSDLLETQQSEQYVLETLNDWNQRRADYLVELDTFKVTLGLPIDLDFAPDPQELKILTERGLVKPDMTLEEAIQTANEDRLDLQTTRDAEEDDARKLLVALWDFLPNLDVGYQYSTAETRETDRPFPRFRDNDQTWSLDFSLPTDWTPRRNSYRSSQIALEQTKRARQEKEDNVNLEVRTLWRQLEYQMKNHEIQIDSVELARLRVENYKLQDELLGTVLQRDIIDAQTALLKARDDLTNALVTYTIARLQFWRAIERLEIDPKGMWYE